jgi:hypothetical protein
LEVATGKQQTKQNQGQFSHISATAIFGATIPRDAA